MRITAGQIRQIIREELIRSLGESDETSGSQVKGVLPDRTGAQLKQDFTVAKNALTGRRFKLYSDSTPNVRWSDLSWLDADGNAPMGQSYWGALGGGGAGSYKYVMHPGQEYLLIAASNARQGEFVVTVRDDDTGGVIMTQSVTQNDEQFSGVIEFPIFSIKGDTGARGHYVTVEVVAKGVPKSDLILGQVMRKEVIGTPK